jgi:hypothetical protein
MGGLKDHELSDIRAAAAELSPVWAARLSVFWSDPNFVVGRFPPLDRIDYLDHAVTLVERQRSTPPRPTLDEIRTYLAGAPFAGWFASARQLAEKSELGSNEHKSYLRTLLYPARFIMSWRTGRVASNDEAVAFLRTAVPTAWTSISSNGRWSAEGERKNPSGFGSIETFFPNIPMCARGSRTRAWREAELRARNAASDAQKTNTTSKGACRRFGRYWSKSGHRAARALNSSVANDPERR